MTENKTEYLTNNDFKALMARLGKHLDAERMEQLADLLDEVSGETGYGRITLIVASKNVVQLKAEKSYK